MVIRPRFMPAFVIAALATAVSAAAADPARLERVVLLPSSDRVSVVFEMADAPMTVTSRRISSAVLEVEAGPATAVHVDSLVAPAGVRFVSSVAVLNAVNNTRPVLRARITLREASRSAIRMIGRRVYVDLSMPEAPSPRRAVTRSAPPAVAATRPGDEDYRATVGPAIDELDRLGPFMISAASSPSPEVLAAIGETVGRAAQTIRSASVPDGAQPSHALLLSALDLASRAVDPEFTGDRVAEARQAVVLLDQAKASIK